jgi:hypothetical protein
VLIGFNDLAAVSPELAAELVDPSLATTLTQGSGKKVRWFCDGTDEVAHPRYEWSATVANRSAGYACPVCSGRAVLVGWNDLAAVSPELAAELVDPSLATTVTEFAHKKVRWFCDGTDDISQIRATHGCGYRRHCCPIEGRSTISRCGT